MANNFHKTDEVKSFHKTQTLPFCFHTGFLLWGAKYFREKWSQERVYIKIELYLLVIIDTVNLEMLEKLGKIAGWNVKGKSKVLVSHRAWFSYLMGKAKCAYIPLTAKSIDGKQMLPSHSNLCLCSLRLSVLRMWETIVIIKYPEIVQNPMWRR